MKQEKNSWMISVGLSPVPQPTQTGKIRIGFLDKIRQEAISERARNSYVNQNKTDNGYTTCVYTKEQVAELKAEILVILTKNKYAKYEDIRKELSTRYKGNRSNGELSIKTVYRLTKLVRSEHGISRKEQRTHYGERKKLSLSDWNFQTKEGKR